MTKVSGKNEMTEKREGREEEKKKGEREKKLFRHS